VNRLKLKGALALYLSAYLVDLRKTIKARRARWAPMRDSVQLS